MKRISEWVLKLKKDIRGQVFVLAAGMLPVIIGMGAMAVDVGYVHVARNLMQNAADAGALSGAQILATGGTQSNAQATAIQYSTQNMAGRASLASATTQVNITNGGTQIQVNVRQPNLGLLLAPVIGINTADVRATASAQLSSVSSVPPNNVVPIGIICNTPGVGPASDNCTGVLNVGDTFTQNRFCGNYFRDGGDSNECGNAIGEGETFLQGITFDEDNSTTEYRERFYNGLPHDVHLWDDASALSGNRKGWKSGIENRLSEATPENKRDYMVFPVLKAAADPSLKRNTMIHGFVQVRVTSFVSGKAGDPDIISYTITKTSFSNVEFDDSGQGLDIGSIVGVRLSE